MSSLKPSTGSSSSQQQAVGTDSSVPVVKESYRQQPDDLDVTRNNEATNEFQARTIELRNQRPQWITYYQ